MAIDHSSPQLETKIPFYRDERVLRWAAQVISTVIIIGFIIWTVINFIDAADARGLTLNLDFLAGSAGFPISNPPIEYNPSMSIGRAFLVGLINTLVVSIIGIIAATIIGTLMALARLSSNWLLSHLALMYIEFHRNIPLLVLLYLWYFSVFAKLPKTKDSIILPGPIYINVRGLYAAWPRLTETGNILLISGITGIVLAIIAFKVLHSRRQITGKEFYAGPVSIALLILGFVIGWFLSGGNPLWLDIPVLKGYNYTGGMRLTPEFSGLLVALTMYTAGFIAEVVRAGIQAVDRGQIEAAKAVGLSGYQTLSLVTLPQALRIIVPPMISQYLSLTKNSSLALAIGFQDVFSVGKIAINQAGRAVPVFALIMATYLGLSLITSLFMNIYNRRIQFVTR